MTKCYNSDNEGDQKAMSVGRHRTMVIVIEPLKKEYLTETIALGKEVFVNDEPDKIALAIEKSLNPAKEEMLKIYGGASIQYWIAKENRRVAGAIGYYLTLEDADEAAWLGWFFVRPEARGKKMGLQLLETVIDTVTKAGKTYLRVYSSSDDPLEKRAHQIYAQRGFVPFRDPDYNPYQKGMVTYLQLNLQENNIKFSS